MKSLAQTGSQPPFVVYIGNSGSEAEAAMKADQAAHHYEVFEGPGRRKNNSSYDATAIKPGIPQPPAASADPIEIPADIAALKKPELVLALTAAIARITELECAAAAAAEAAAASITVDLADALLDEPAAESTDAAPV